MLFEDSLLPHILSEIFTSSRPGHSFIIAENWHNDILCKIRPKREKKHLAEIPKTSYSFS